jgi:uncharacterized membrane protein YbhN (UPF0104 family)
MESFFSKLSGRKFKAVLILVSIALIVFLLLQVNLGELLSALEKASPLLLALALLFSFLGLCARVVRWSVLLGEERKIGFRELFPVQAGGIALSNLSPGKMFEPIKVVFLKPLGFKYAFALLTVLWERVMDLLILFIFSVGVIFGLSEFLRNASLLLLAFLIALALVLVFLLPQAIAFFSRIRFLYFLKKISLQPLHSRNLFYAFLLTFVVWAMDFLAVYSSFLALNVSVDFLFIASVFSASVLIGVISFLPGGFGSTEAVFLFLLLPTGYAQPLLLAAILVARIATLVFTSLIGFATLSFVGKKKSQ